MDFYDKLPDKNPEDFSKSFEVIVYKQCFMCNKKYQQKVWMNSDDIFNINNVESDMHFCFGSAKNEEGRLQRGIIWVVGYAILDSAYGVPHQR